MNKPHVFILVALLLTLRVSAQFVSNYSFSSTTGTFSVIQGSPGSVSPTLTSGTWDDGYINNVPIGFPFVFNGVAYTTMAVSTNGWAKFGGTVTAADYTNNLNTSTTRPVIAPLWDDLFLNPMGFTYKTTGAAPYRMCTLEWLNVTWSYAAAAPSISFQIRLYESNKRVEFIYRQESGTVSGPSASVGISGATSTDFLSLTNTGSAPGISSATETTNLIVRPATGQVYRFDHYATVPRISTVTPITGSINTLITISGSNFEASPSLNIVYCGAVKGTVVSATTTQLVVIVPRGTTFDRISVTSAVHARTGESDEQFAVRYGCGGYVNVLSYNPRVDFSSGSGARILRVADIDGDGKTDVAVSTDNGGGAVRVFRNTSTTGVINTSSLSAPVDFYTSAGQPGEVWFADADGDGKKDMFASDYSTVSLDSISVFRNTSVSGSLTTSSFSPRVTFKVAGYPSAHTADLNGDGKPEMIVACRSADQLIIRQNNCVVGSITSSSFGSNVIFTAADAPDQLATGDLDNDGRIDIVTAQSFGASMSVFKNVSTPSGPISTSTLAARVDYAMGTSCNDVMIADMDGDGKQDVIVSSTGLYFSVFRNTSVPGNITFAARQDFTVQYNAFGIDLADIDGDGKADVIVTHSSPDRVGVYKNTSTSGVLSFQSGSMWIGGTNVFDACAADIDGDGKPELIASTLATPGTVSILQNVNNAYNQIAPASVLNSTLYCDDGTWKTFADPNDPSKILCAISQGSNQLGLVTVNEYRDAAPGNYNGQKFLQRHYKITPYTQPSSSVMVRLFFTPTELSNLMSADPNVTGISSLSVTKYSGPTEDGTYAPGDATSLQWIPPASITTGYQYGAHYLQFSVSSFSEFWIHGGNGVLPIELTSFDAQPVGAHVDITWTTASETNNAYFTVEKTQDGTMIVTSDTVQGAGNSAEELHYTSTDEQPFSGTSYYRLKQVDFNGHYTYSEWKAVSFQPTEIISVYPNPCNGTFHIDLPGAYDSQWTVNLVSSTGQEIYNRTAPKWDNSTHAIQAPAGTYIIRVTGENAVFSQKIIITDQ